MASPTARCPACTRRRHTSRAARATIQFGAYTEDSAEYQQVLDRLLKKWATAEEAACRAPSSMPPRGSKIGIVSRRQLRRRDPRGDRHSQDARASAWITCACAPSPSARTSRSSSRRHEVLFVVEQNRDAQLRALLTLETAVDKSKLRRCCTTADCRSPRRSSSRGCSRSCSRAGSRPGRGPWLSGAMHAGGTRDAPEAAMTFIWQSPRSPIRRCRPTRSA